QFLGLSGAQYLRFVCILAAGFFFKGFISRFLSKYVFKLFAREKDGDHSDSFASHIRKPFGNFIFTVFAYVATMQLAPMLDDILLFGKKVKGIDNEILKDAAKAI